MSRIYGKWAGNKKGFTEDESRCIVEVSRGNLFNQCSRKRGHGLNGWFCTQHAKQHADGKRLYIPEDKP